ncbi:hypothetical protein AgCh_034067 [Apium graveolens]
MQQWLLRFQRIRKQPKAHPPYSDKHISIQLKRLLASGSLTKIKSSFKLSAPVKLEVVKKKDVSAKLKKAVGYCCEAEEGHRWFSYEEEEHCEAKGQGGGDAGEGCQSESG